MNIATGITTAPRPGPDVLARCVESVRLAGLSRPLVFAEPKTPIPDDVDQAADVIHRHERLGDAGNWLQSLRDTLEARPKADTILILQDDVTLSRGVCDVLEGCLWPSSRCGVVQLCTSVGYALQGQGLTRLPRDALGDFLGAWACLFPRHVAHQLVAYAATRRWKSHGADPSPNCPPNERRGSDRYIGLVLKALKYEGWVCRPSLALHSDAPSSLDHGGYDGVRRTLEFVEDAVGWESGTTARYHLPWGTVEPRRISVVIPIAGDCGKMARACLERLADHACVPIRVIVVDNGTPPAVGEAVLDVADQVGLPLTWIRNEADAGFMRACNQGIHAAGDDDVLLLNPACRVGPNCISMLVYTLALRCKAAAAGPVTLGDGHQSLNRHARQKQVGFVHPEELGPEELPWRLDGWAPTLESSLGFFCVLIRRSALDSVGLLDDNWCKRAVHNGRELVLQPGAFAC
jgi:hypothetical protein